MLLRGETARRSSILVKLGFYAPKKSIHWYRALKWHSTCTNRAMRNSKPTPRYMCSEVVFIARADPGNGPALLGNLEEIGEDFAEVLTDRAFPSGSAVQIVTKASILQGLVECCSRDKALGFFVRVKLYPESRWSPGSFIPQHMLTLGHSTRKASTLKVA